MRIGFDAKRAFFNQRGLGNFSRDTIRILSSHYPQDLFYLFSPKEKPTICFEIGQNCQTIYPTSSFYKKHTTLWRSFGIKKDIAPLNLDIYHGLSHEIPMGIEKLPMKTVVTMHDLIFLQYPHLYPAIDRELYKQKYFRSCRMADKIIAISKQTKQDIMQYIGIDEQKIEVIYQGCHPIFSTKAEAAQQALVREKYHLPEHFLLNVGAIEARKNQRLIIQSIEHGKIDLPLVILGRPTEYLQELKTYIAHHALEQKVWFLTDVPMVDLPVVYQMATLFVYPSIFEGFGIPIVEAMTSGVPVITSCGSCMEETGGDAACYVSPNEEEQLTFAIESILSDSQRRQTMIEKGREHILRFSDEKIAESTMQVYKSLL